MSKQKKWTLAVVLLLLAAVGGTLAWWYLPRPLVRDLPLVKIQMFDAGTGADIDLTEQVELSAVMELLGEAECYPQWRPGPHSNEEYPLDIKFSGGGEHWIVILGSRGGFAVDNSQKNCLAYPGRRSAVAGTPAPAAGAWSMTLLRLEKERK